jgi:hypothetical protein
MPRQRKPTRPRVTRVSVTADQREQIDWDRYAWALLQYCRLKIQAEDEANGAP